MLDYIIVGFGLGGAVVAHQLEERGRSFMIFDSGNQNSSRVAGGMMNPVILKRFTLAWRADEQLKLAERVYSDLEGQLNSEFLTPVGLFRKFSSVEEQNNWFEAADKPQLAPYIDTRLVSDLSPAIPSPYGFGKVHHTKRLDTNIFLDSYGGHLEKMGVLLKKAFDYAQLELLEEGVEYNGIRARKVIFCEGFGVRHNPFFNYLPVTGNKGEYIIVRSPELKLDVTVKSAVFISPAGNDHYVVGATYNNHDKTPEPTAAARQEIVQKLERLIHADYEIVHQIAGIRPSTGDRRPLVGQHPEHQDLFCCNGFGSRGVLIAPMAAHLLLDFVEKSQPLPAEVDLSRFSRRYWKTR